MNDVELIAVYTREQAIADGELVDCTKAAREYGIRIPVALTRASWELCVELSDAARRAGNDVVGRLRDVLWMLTIALRHVKGEGRIAFSLYCVTTRTRTARIELHAVIGPGDHSEPVITVMLPEED
jgi:hypothetical protein